MHHDRDNGRPRMDVVVLGAGPAGVAAAWRAARDGAAVTVLERAQRPGGAAGSFEVAGIRVDHGSHRLHRATDPAILAELRTVLGDELQERPRNGRIRLAGRWIAFPLQSGDLLRRLPRSFAAGAAFDAVTAPARRARRDTFDEVVRAGLGPTMWRRFYGPYARKIWGVDPSQLSGEQARRRIAADTPWKVLVRVLRGGAGTPPTFFYPRSGFGTITERLAQAAADAGVTLRYGTAVTGVDIERHGFTVRTDAEDTVHARHLWSTIPLTALAAMVRPAAPAEVLEGAKRLRFRAMTLVYLVLDVDRWTPYDAHYLPEPSTPVTRVSEPKNYRDGDDPSDRTVLCAELPCDVGDDIWQADEAALARLVADGLSEQGLPRPEPTGVVVRRLSHAYPIYTTDFARHFDAIDHWAAGIPNLVTFGRQGLFAHDNTHHAMAMAWAAAGALRGGHFDEASWSQARERFATHVVED